MALEAGARPSRRRIRLRRLAAIALLPALAAAGFGVAQVADTDADSPPAADPPATANAPAQPAPKPAVQPPAHPKTRPGSNPSVLPGNVLVADKANNRLLEIDPYGRVVWRFPRPGDLAPGQTFQVPDDAFYTPNGRSIVATQEDDFAISAVDVVIIGSPTGTASPASRARAPDHLYNPDDAMMLPGGQILTADIKNCRICWSPAALPLPGPADRLERRAVSTTLRASSAARMAPSRLRTGTHGDRDQRGAGWTSCRRRATSPGGPPPGLHVPVGHQPGCARSLPQRGLHHPGEAMETFNTKGQLLWRFRGACSRSSIAGDAAAERRHPRQRRLQRPRDRRRPGSNQIVWQYGHTGVSPAPSLAISTFRTAWTWRRPTR